jgi:hypothetical protein
MLLKMRQVTPGIMGELDQSLALKDIEENIRVIPLARNDVIRVDAKSNHHISNDASRSLVTILVVDVLATHMVREHLSRLPALAHIDEVLTLFGNGFIREANGCLEIKKLHDSPFICEYRRQRCTDHTGLSGYVPVATTTTGEAGSLPRSKAARASLSASILERMRAVDC